MYKTLIFIILVVGCIGSNVQLFKSRSYNIHRLDSNVGLDFCPECINEAVESIDTLLNLILNEGIITACGDLCAALVNKTGSKAFGVVCDLACEAVGIDEFVRLLSKTDIDPIYYCELAKLCPINDQSDAKFINFGITPHSGRSGTDFVIDCSFISKNGTGTGMIRIEIVSATQDYLLAAQKPGTYIEKIGIKTLDLNCDATKGGCKKWPLGTYNISAQICNGECGSQHPHSSIYDIGKGTFVVTK